MKSIKMFKVLTAYKFFLCKCSTFHLNIVADKRLMNMSSSLWCILVLPVGAYTMADYGVAYSFVGDLPEDGQIVAEICRRHMVK